MRLPAVPRAQWRARPRSWLASPPGWLARPLLWLAPLAFLAVFFFLPFGRILAYSFSWEALSGSNLQLALHTLGFTLYQAVLSTFLTLLVGLPAAYLMARFSFPLKSVLRALTAVPFMLPTVVRPRAHGRRSSVSPWRLGGSRPRRWYRLE